jgi:hypothetical protein
MIPMTPPKHRSPLAIGKPLHHPVHHRQAADSVDLRELPLPSIIERLLLLPMAGAAGFYDAVWTSWGKEIEDGRYYFTHIKIIRYALATSRNHPSF